MAILNYFPTSGPEQQLFSENPTVFPAAFSVYNTGGVTYVAAPRTSQEVYAKSSGDTDECVDHNVNIYPIRNFYIWPMVTKRQTSHVDIDWIQIDVGHIYNIQRIAYVPSAQSFGKYVVTKDGVVIYEAQYEDHVPTYTNRLFNWTLEIES